MRYALYKCHCGNFRYELQGNAMTVSVPACHGLMRFQWLWAMRVNTGSGE